MSKQFWNERYSQHETVYGDQPNRFFKSFIDSNEPGSILLPAEGEGRNALYAASKGWDVHAFDQSEIGREKTLHKAKEKGIEIKYDILNVDDFHSSVQYDAIGLIYVHLEPALRKKFHKELVKSLKPGGKLVLEAFNPNQRDHNSGGPKDVSMLYDTEMLRDDFSALIIDQNEALEVVLNEGPFHQGSAEVVRFRGHKNRS